MYWSCGAICYTFLDKHFKILPEGTPVTIDEDCHCKWIAVGYGGRIGYVSSKYLSRYYQN